MSNKIIIWIVSGLVLIAACAVFVFTSQGYGKVSEGAYKAATALHSACAAKNEQRLAAVEKMLEDDSLEISIQEKQWLREIIEQARAGRWESAAAASRRMMEDQVREL